MKSLLIRFSAALGGSLVIGAAVFSGAAGASASISNTGPGSVNIISGSSSGSIDTTGPHSVNVIGNTSKPCHHIGWFWCNGCWRVCW